MPSSDGLTRGVLISTIFCSIGAFGFGIDNGEIALSTATMRQALMQHPAVLRHPSPRVYSNRMVGCCAWASKIQHKLRDFDHCTRWSVSYRPVFRSAVDRNRARIGRNYAWCPLDHSNVNVEGRMCHLASADATFEEIDTTVGVLRLSRCLASLSSGQSVRWKSAE